MNHKRIIEAIAIVTVAVILIGEVIVYTSGTDDFNIEVSITDDGVEYRISVDGSQPFTVAIFDNGGALPIDDIYIWYDERYVSAYRAEEGPVGSQPADLDYYIDQLVKNLKMRGISAVILSADELKNAMEKDIGEGKIKGLVSASGALPDTIYTGNDDDLIFTWLNEGGRLYWSGNLLGAFYSTTDGLIPVEGYQQLFFGSNCLNTGETDFASEETQGNDIRSLLSLKNNRVKYAVNVGELPTDRSYLAVGYSEGEYSSIVLTEYGEGSICVMGGDLSRNQWSDMAQIIASGITHRSTVIGQAGGSVRYDTATGTIGIPDADDIVVYVYLGGYYPVYGKMFHFA